jgi:hypothetical protein
MNIITNDLSKYGYRELDEAGKLLMAYAKNGADYMGDGITLNFNTLSGFVFLSDEDYNVAVLNDEGELEQFVTCGECGEEDVVSAIIIDPAGRGGCDRCKVVTGKRE